MILLQLLWSFTKIGFTSFGGLSMIPLISSEMQVHQWMTAEEVSDIVAIAEMTPGPLGLNCATFAGMRTAGLPGAIAANLGVLMPTLTVCALAALFFQRFRNSPVMRRVMVGVRPACVGIPEWDQLYGKQCPKPAQHRNRGAGAGAAAEIQSEHPKGDWPVRLVGPDLLWNILKKPVRVWFPLTGVTLQVSEPPADIASAVSAGDFFLSHAPLAVD